MIIRDLRVERIAQEMKWGTQSHPDGTGPTLSSLTSGPELITSGSNSELAQSAIARCDELHRSGAGTWENILTEEWAEALATSDPIELRRELIQVMAVAAAWIADIDSRSGTEVTE
jgi:hypothetical protein